MDTNAGIDKTNIAEAGDTRRADATNALADRRFGLESQAKGFDIRSAQRREDLLKQYDQAKTPAERAAIERQLPDVFGKPSNAEWAVQVTPAQKNPDGSTTEGSVYRYNKATGDVQRVDTASRFEAMPDTKDKLVKGRVYQTARGPATWNGQMFDPLKQ